MKWFALIGVFLLMVACAQAVVCDGTTDATNAIQALLNAGGVASLPLGTCLVSATLTYTGNSSAAFIFEGQGAGRGPSGTVLRWIGPVGGTLLRLLGANNTLLADIAFDGNGLAAYDVQVLSAQPSGAASSGVRLRRLVLGGALTAALQLGNSNYQVSEVSMGDLYLVGYGTPGTTLYGMQTAGANTKDFTCAVCNITGFQYGVWHGGSAFLVMTGTTFASNTVADLHVSTGEVLLNGGNSEGSAMLAQGSCGGNSGTLEIHGFEWVGSAGLDDYIINVACNIILSGNRFVNARGGNTTVPKVKAASDASAGTAGTITSIGNYYANITGSYGPFYNGSDAALLPPWSGAAPEVFEMNDSTALYTGGSFRFLKNYVRQ